VKPADRAQPARTTAVNVFAHPRAVLILPSLKYTSSARATRAILLSLIAVAFGLACAAGSASAAGFEWDGATITGVTPGAISTDGAGRVYVPVRNQGKVLIYDNARGGNRLLATVGVGRLQDPIATTIDLRGYLYVADAAKNTVVAFTPYYWGSEYLATSGAPGGGLGQFSGLRALTADLEPRIYTAEADNGRVQSLDPSRGALTSLFAFGVTDPGPWGPISSVAIDESERFVVSSSSTSDPLRLYAPNGAFVGNAASAGSGAGQVSGAQGVNFDPLDRLVVADTGNNRVDFFNTIAGGLGPIAQYGSSGGGVGQFNAPTSIATAPGALVYVADTGNNRVVRLRYDDADHDSALDAADNCPGLSNPLQGDIDSDGIGDDCDPDIDGDLIANGADKCPLVRPFTDRNKDGCQDPFSKVSQLRKSAAGVTLRGTASGSSLGIARVDVAIARPGAKGLHFVRAKGTTHWSVKVSAHHLKPAKYKIFTRAVQKKSKLVEPTKRAKASFRFAG
jgi:Thrombospondin type 3 repeat